jgi:hypothetical protein
MRPINPGDTVIDQFPVFEFDGYSKHSGLHLIDFTITTYHAGVATPLSVSLAEIGTSGEYRIEYTPPGTGYWLVEILIDYNKDIWRSEVEAAFTDVSGILAAVEAVQHQVDKIDLAPTIGPAAVTDGSLMDRMMNKSSATKTYNQGTDSLEALRDRTG